MGLVYGGQPLFQGQAFVLLGTLQRGRGQGYLVEDFGVEPGLFFDLLSATLVKGLSFVRELVGQ